MVSSSSLSVAVCGAGILGLLSAYRLMQAGAKVRIYDPQGFESDNASRVAGGMLAPYSEVEHMAGAWIDAGLAGIEFWRGFADECGGTIDFAQRGSLIIAHKPDRYMLERFKEHIVREVEGASRVVEVNEIEPELDDDFQDGLYLEQEAHLNPSLVMERLGALLREGGAEMLAEAVDMDALATGNDFVIDVRGMGAKSDAPELRAVKGELAIVRNREFMLSRPVRLMHPRYPLYIVPRAGNVFMIGATQIESEGSGVAMRSAMELMSALYSLHPSFGDAELLELKSGLRPSYADNLPRMDVAGNVLRLNGSFRHGYLLAPVMAGAALDYVYGRDNAHIGLLSKGVIDESVDQRRGKELRGAA